MRAYFAAVVALSAAFPLVCCSGHISGSDDDLGLASGGTSAVSASGGGGGTGSVDGSGGDIAAPDTGGSGGSPPIVLGVGGANSSAGNGSNGSRSNGGEASGGDGNGGESFELPDGFTETEEGGFKLGKPVASGNKPPDSGSCTNKLTGIVRDFKAGPPDGHPDFEMMVNEYVLETGIVKDALGKDRKPVYEPAGATEYTTGNDAFNEWYRTLDDQPDQNKPFYLTLYLAPQGHDSFIFRSEAFFPIDGEGFGDQSNPHNFHFTFELHTQFTYKGGEEFTFIGDDDVWVFINKKLAIDLGGVHSALEATADLDAQADDLGIEQGETYDLDMFQAERHTTESHFRVETTIDFTNCGDFVPDVPPEPR